MAGWLDFFGLVELEAQAGTLRALLTGEEEAAHSLEKTDLSAAAAGRARFLFGHKSNYLPARREMQVEPDDYPGLGLFST